MIRRMLGVAAIALAAALTGCGKGGGDAADAEGGPGAQPRITVCWAQWAPADGLAELGKQFEAETGIAVDVTQIPWPDFQRQVFLDFTKKETPFDIVVGDSQWIGRGATAGLYLELTDWLPEAVDLDAIVPSILENICEYPADSGRYYAAPCESDAMGFAYRRDWFEDPAEQAAFSERYGRPLTAPETWSEFREVAEFFTRPDEQQYGCVLVTGRGYDEATMGFQQIMWAFGGSWGDRETLTAAGRVDAPESVEALAFLKSLMPLGPRGAESHGFGKAMEAFVNGSTAMSMNYFAFFPTITAEMGDKAGFFVMPTHEGRRVISLGGQGFSISTKVAPQQQERAKRFIAWFLQQSVQEQWITKPAGFTAHAEILESEAFRAAAPYNAPFADSLPYLRDFWRLPVYNELLSVSQQYLGQALDGEIQPAAALQAIAEGHDRILTEYKRDAAL